MKYNRNLLKEKIIKAARTAFNKIIKEKREETFFAFALVTLDDVLSCYAYANSIESHARTLLKNKSLIEESNLPNDLFKWDSAEWEYSCIAHEEFDEVYDLSEHIQDQLPDNLFATYKSDFLDLMIETMQVLRTEGIFHQEKSKENQTLFIDILDSFGAEEIQRKSSAVLNPEKVHIQFLHSISALHK